MTEFEKKLIELLTEAVDEIGNIRSAMDTIETTLDNIAFEQAHPGATRRLEQRAEETKRRRENGEGGNDEPLPF